MTRSKFPRDARGFSLIELLVATGLLLIVMSSVFEMMSPVHGAFRTEPESADVQQRLRVAADSLAQDLMAAGTGLSQAPGAGPLTDFFPPLLPLRQGRRLPDAAGTFKNDTVTLVRLEPAAAQTTIAEALPARTSVVALNLGPGCPPADASCGFKSGTTVAVFDGTGAYDLFSVTAVDASGLHLQHNMRDSGYTYGANVGRIASANSRTYYLKADVPSNTFQLMRYDGDGGADTPVVDHVVGLAFQYFGDPDPPTIRRPLTEAVGPWTTYGPSPPVSGDNCVFAGNGTPTPAPALAVLGAEPALVPLSAALLSDGPWCPDASSPNRFDADLLRIRRVIVTLRVESAATSLRGPAGRLFMRAGTASGRAFVPDQEVRFDVAPRNLNLKR
jgi:prepilin-type N-terminal cleavage/methylation domain-containing protein